MSLRQAINAKCRECIYDEYAAGTWRQQTGACTAESCPLYSFRPLPQGHTANRANSVDFGAELDDLQVVDVGR